MRATIDIEPSRLSWAIARAGFELETFLDKHPGVQKWLNGEGKPTVKQLESFSKSVYLPFGYLLLPHLPEERLPIPFFRSGRSQARSVSIHVYDTILILQQRQEWLSEYLRENDFQTLDFVGRFRQSENVLAIVADIRKTLKLDEHWASHIATWEESLALLTQRIEDSGIMTVFNGVVENNTHRPINVDECRGFVLIDDYAPFMFINSADSKAAQMFTIAHELAHVWTGHSAGFDFRRMTPANDPVEVLCDKVAAELLVPESAFNAIWKVQLDIMKIAKHFKVSPIVAARRALDTGNISKVEFFAFYNSYITREYTKKEKQTGGGDFYATAKKRLGMSYAAHINNAVKAGILLHRDAYRLTSLKGDTYHKFFSEHF